MCKFSAPMVVLSNTPLYSPSPKLPMSVGVDKHAGNRAVNLSHHCSFAVTKIKMINHVPRFCAKCRLIGCGGSLPRKWSPTLPGTGHYSVTCHSSRPLIGRRAVTWTSDPGGCDVSVWRHCSLRWRTILRRRHTVNVILSPRNTWNPIRSNMENLIDQWQPSNHYS